jgi:hypothetical protein
MSTPLQPLGLQLSPRLYPETSNLILAEKNAWMGDSADIDVFWVLGSAM